MDDGRVAEPNGDAMQLSVDVEGVLAQDPVGAYDRMDDKTRSRYHAVIQRWAQRSGRSPTDIATLVLRHAQATAGCGGRGAATHVGYYLIDAGVLQIEAELALRWTLRDRFRRACKQRLALLYPAIVLTIISAVGLAAGAYAVRHGASWTLGATVFVATAIIFYGAASLVGRLLCEPWIEHRVLPKMAFAAGIPATHRTLVVVPTVLRDAAQAEAAVARLVQLAEVDPERNLHFALLSDFADAPQAHMPGDTAILAALERAAARAFGHADGAAGAGMARRAFVLHRERRWYEPDRVWMGWQRKRGKLEELATLLRQPGATTSYTWDGGGLGELQCDAPYRYVICLDEDTWMGEGEALFLARTAAHPLNHAEFCPKTGRLLRGYTFFDPVFRAYPAERAAPPKRLPGPRLATPDFRFDLFNGGFHFGKGLIDVDAYYHHLTGRLPVRATLSHDIIDGLLGGRAVVMSAYFYEPESARQLPSFAQGRRWIRGAIQQTPWLLPWVREADGVLRRNPLSPMARLMLASALMRTAKPVLCLMMVVCGWTLLGGSAWVWTSLFLFPNYYLLVIPLFERTVHWLWALARGEERPSFRDVISVAQLRAAAWMVGEAAHSGLLTAIAAARGFWRGFVSGRGLLEWRAQTSVVSSTGSDITHYGREYLPSMILSGFVLVLVGVVRPENLVVATPLVIAWLAEFAVCWMMDQPRVEPGPRVAPGVVPGN